MLIFEGKCSYFRVKPAHLVGHLPAAESVRDLAKRHGFDTELVPMKNTHHAEMMELLIGRNLDWARSKGEDQP